MKRERERLILSNRAVYTLIVFGIIILFGIGVYAYNSGYNDPAIMGHSGDEIEWKLNKFSTKPTCDANAKGLMVFDTTNDKPYICAASGVWKPLDSDNDKDGLIASFDSNDNSPVAATTASAGNILSGQSAYSYTGGANGGWSLITGTASIYEAGEYYGYCRSYSNFVARSTIYECYAYTPGYCMSNYQKSCGCNAGFTRQLFGGGVYLCRKN